MELRQLSAFVAVAEEGAFTRAATRLGVVQPAVSQAVRRLEEEIGIALVERSSRRVALTAAGEAFLPHARAVLARMAEAERAAAELASGRAGTVRLATAEGAAEVVAAIIARHRAAHPDVRVELRAPRSPKLHAVLGGEVDAALVHTAPRTPGLAFTEVSSEPWRAVASARHPLAGNGPVALAALARDPLVLVGGEGTPRLREAFLALLRGAGVEPVLGEPLPTLDDALVEIARSRSWTFLRAPNVPGAARLGVVEIPLEDDLPPGRIWLAHRSSAPPATRSLAALAGRLHRAGTLIGGGTPPDGVPSTAYAERAARARRTPGRRSTP
jgi:DNA-binding transcriptional LysR family regulator